MAIVCVIDTTTGDCILGGVAESCLHGSARRTIAAWRRHSPDEVARLSDVPVGRAVCLRMGIGRTYAVRFAADEWLVAHIYRSGEVWAEYLRRPSWAELAQAAASVANRQYPEV